MNYQAVNTTEGYTASNASPVRVVGDEVIYYFPLMVDEMLYPFVFKGKRMVARRSSEMLEVYMEQ